MFLQFQKKHVCVRISYKEISLRLRRLKKHKLVKSHMKITQYEKKWRTTDQLPGGNTFRVGIMWVENCFHSLIISLFIFLFFYLYIF